MAQGGLRGDKSPAPLFKGSARVRVRLTVTLTLIPILTHVTSQQNRPAATPRPVPCPRSAWKKSTVLDNRHNSRRKSRLLSNKSTGQDVLRVNKTKMPKIVHVHKKINQYNQVHAQHVSRDVNICVSRKISKQYQFLPRDATQSAVMRSYVVCPSVRVWRSGMVIT